MEAEPGVRAFKIGDVVLLGVAVLILSSILLRAHKEDLESGAPSATQPLHKHSRQFKFIFRGYYSMICSHCGKDNSLPLADGTPHAYVCQNCTNVFGGRPGVVVDTKYRLPAPAVAIETLSTIETDHAAAHLGVTPYSVHWLDWHYTRADGGDWE